jgi:DNA-binding NtrC family response regulator
VSLRLAVQPAQGGCAVATAVETPVDVSVDAQLIGASAGFQGVLARVLRFGACNVPILIEGETSTKELVARARHYRSRAVAVRSCRSIAQRYPSSLSSVKCGGNSEQQCGINRG